MLLSENTSTLIVPFSFWLGPLWCSCHSVPFHVKLCCFVLLFPLLSSAEHWPALRHRAEKQPGTFDFHSRWNVSLWFPVLTFKRQEGRKRGVLIRAAYWRSAREGGRPAGMKEDRGRDGGEGEMKEGRGCREGLNEHASYKTVCLCAISQISCWLSFCVSVFRIQP